MTIMFSPDGHYLAAGQGNGAVHLWDLKPETARRAESVPLTTADGLTIPEILKRNAQVMQNLQTMQITVTTTMRQSTPPNGDATVEGSPVTATYIYSAADSQPSMPPTLALVGPMQLSRMRYSFHRRDFFRSTGTLPEWPSMKE